MTEKFNYHTIILFSDTYGLDNNETFKFLDSKFVFTSN